MRRAPKKYTDETRSKITEEWSEWYEESRIVSEMDQEMMEDFVVAHYREWPEDRWPEKYEKDLGEVGTWIIVVEEPLTEMRSRFRLPTPSLWWARPEASRQGAIKHESGKTIPGLYRAVIETPGGSLWLYPHEYVVCSQPEAFLLDEECTIHPLGGRPALDEEKAEQMFYLQARGWTYSQSLMALMDGLDMREWGWCEFPEYAREMFAGVGTKVRLGA